MIIITRISKIKSLLLLPYKLYITKDGLIIRVESRWWRPAVFVPIFIHWLRYWKGVLDRTRSYEKALGRLYELSRPGRKEIEPVSKIWLASMVRYHIQGVNCGYACGWHEEYGYVPEDSCPVHNQIAF